MVSMPNKRQDTFYNIFFIIVVVAVVVVVLDFEVI